MLNKSVVDFLKETSSSSPTPGGGSIAALVASLSVALSSMVVSLTLGKKNYENVQNDMQRMQIILDEYQKKTQDFVRQDIDAYNNVMAQYALPKLTEEEKKWIMSLTEKDFQSQATFIMLTTILTTSIQVLAISPNDGFVY